MEENKISDSLMQETFQEEPQKPSKKPRQPVMVPLSLVITIVCIVIILSVLISYTSAVVTQQKYFKQTLEELANENDSDFSKLEVLAKIVDKYSFYADDLSESEMLDAVLKAYMVATGDHYAEYYTQEEYRQMVADNNGEYVGIGVSVTQTTITIDTVSYYAFNVLNIYKGSPAEEAGIQIGEYIVGIMEDDTFLSIEEIGGYTAALNRIRGEADTNVTVKLVSFNELNVATSRDLTITRKAFVTEPVSVRKTTDNQTAVIYISDFNLLTPHALRDAILQCQNEGVTQFILDVRNNPGGDLQSIKATLTYFLSDGDMILSAIDKDENVVTTYKAEEMHLSGDYASCDVEKNEIGMFKDLNVVVLCNKGTASAAEVFTATFQDYQIGKVVGVTTFGKGIMQSFIPMSRFGAYNGYVKLTTYAYVTKRGTSYHEIGIVPDVEVELSEEAKNKNFYLLTLAEDNQVQKALEQFD